MNNKPLIERFEDKYIPITESGCWIWIAALYSEINGKGYAHFWNKEHHISGHRFAYEHYRGPIPKGMHIDHLCRVRCCVNPWHLELVTCKENIRRGASSKESVHFIKPLASFQKNKKVCKKGHPYSGDNVYFRKDRYGRECKKCQKIAQDTFQRKHGKRKNSKDRGVP